jgi:hypothetical protein
MSDQTAWVCEGTGAGPSSTAWSGSSHAWHTIQIGPGSEICRSSRWRSPQSSQVMVTRIASAGWHCGCDGPRPRTSPPGYCPATNRRHRLLQGGRKGVEVPAANRLRDRWRPCELSTGEFSGPSPAAELAGTSAPFLPPASAGPVSSWGTSADSRVLVALLPLIAGSSSDPLLYRAWTDPSHSLTPSLKHRPNPTEGTHRCSWWRRAGGLGGATSRREHCSQTKRPTRRSRGALTRPRTQRPERCGLPPARLRTRRRLSATLALIASARALAPVRAITRSFPRLRRSVPDRHG